jgi:nicotinate-nucleotide adenylyltransferase
MTRDEPPSPAAIVSEGEHDGGALRVGIFGGSFNPPHVGHVLAAAYALSVAPIDRLLVVPVHRHPFAKELAPFDLRLRMCELAFGELGRAQVSDVESTIEGDSLTLRTLERLREQHPSWRMRLLLGSDVVPDLPKWHRFDRVAELAEPFFLQRSGALDPSLGPAVLPEISSTEVRALLREGRLDEVRRVVPSRVLELVAEARLYAPVRA